MNRNHYIALSELFFYPKDGYKEKVEVCAQLLKKEYPDIISGFERFSDFIASKSIYEIEEIFGITFHIQAICFLDIGYVLFGEDYSRGEFLLNMKGEQAKINHDCGEELADNLPHVLQLMALSKDDELINELAVRAVIPAVEKMLEEFGPYKMKLKQKLNKRKQKVLIMENVVDGNIYQNAIQSLLKVLKKDFEGIIFEEPEAALNAPKYGFEAASCGSACSFISNETQKTVKA